MRPGASVGYVQATRTSLPRCVRTGGAGQLAPKAARTGHASQPRACRVYRHPCTVWPASPSPQVTTLENMIAKLESGSGAACFSTGMAATISVIAGTMKAGRTLTLTRTRTRTPNPNPNPNP